MDKPKGFVDMDKTNNCYVLNEMIMNPFAKGQMMLDAAAGRADEWEMAAIFTKWLIWRYDRSQEIRAAGAKLSWFRRVWKNMTFSWNRGGVRFDYYFSNLESSILGPTTHLRLDTPEGVPAGYLLEEIHNLTAGKGGMIRQFRRWDAALTKITAKAQKLERNLVPRILVTLFAASFTAFMLFVMFSR